MFASLFQRAKLSRVAPASAKLDLNRLFLALGATSFILLIEVPVYAEEPPSRKITLNDALALAENNALKVASKSGVSIERGNKQAAETIRYNPVASVNAGPRFGDAQTTDIEVSLSQTIELGGKRRNRKRVATARLRAAEASAARTAQEIGWAVRRRFAEAQLARLRIDSTKEALEVATELVGITRDRLDAGKGTQLDVNQALAEAARAKAAALHAEQLYEESCIALSSAAGVKAEQKLEPVGDFSRMAEIAIADANVKDLVGKGRPEFEMFAAEREAAQAERRLEGSLAIPDVALGATWTREEGGIDIFTFGISFDLPLWNRNQGRRAAAESAVTRTNALTRYEADELKRGAQIALERYRRSRQRVDALDSGARGSLRENLELTRDSFEAGKISIVELTILRKSFVDVELAFIAAVAEELAAYFDLKLALGADPVSP